MARCVHLLLLVLLLSGVGYEAAEPPTYRAGVVEFQPLPYTGDDQETMMNNARLVAEYTVKAKHMGVDLLVFPEYGITTFEVGGGGEENKTRESLSSGVQDTPDPKVVQWNPCLEPDRFNNTRVLTELSCAARNNSVVVLVNLLSRETCSEHPAAKCPPDGHFIFNTNVVFAKNGTLIARYHKYHLFGEPLLDPAPKPEYVIVDAGFVKFGTFICFDIFYEEPALKLVTELGIRNLVFSTALINELPFKTAPQVFSQFSHGLGVNLIVSNMYRPPRSRLGSGIHSSSSGALNETWDLSTPGRLIIADLPIYSPVPSFHSTTCPPPTSDTIHPKDYNMTEAINRTVFVMADVPSSKPTNKTHRIYYEPMSSYAHLVLDGAEGNLELCQDGFCCKLSYRFSIRDASDVYVYAVRNGQRRIGFQNRIGIQSCNVIRCEKSGDIETCGHVPETPTTSRFDRLELEGVFAAKAIVPDVFTTELSLVPTRLWQFSKQSCKSNVTKEDGGRVLAKLNLVEPISNAILVATIYGRMFEWDESY